MFIYLSKKIQIPQNIQLSSIAWNPDQGWIACGGASGMLKVLMFAAAEKPTANGKEPMQMIDDARGNLSMNQPLDGHNGEVRVLAWNEAYHKLTTSDEYGLIIVWMLHKGVWHEEMINNRHKSVVSDMKWTPDGQRICIAYQDGAVIVGSVDGNRLWGRELDVGLALVEWSPDSRYILFGTTKGEVHLYDNVGNFLGKLSNHTGSEDSSAKLVAIQWYNGLNGFLDPNVPTLAIAFDNGRVQVMRDDSDDTPVLIDTGLEATCVRWNNNGSTLAISGRSSAGDKPSQQVQFFTPYGKHLRSLKVPGNCIKCFSWEGLGLRIALAVDSFIYFANIRPDYAWGYFGDTLVYSFTRPERQENCVCFWDTSNEQLYVKYVKQLIAVRAAGEYCVFATRTDDGSGQYILILCNAIGSPVDSKYIDIEPIYLTMTPYHIFVANNELVYTWEFRTPAVKLTSIRNKRKESRERMFHIDDPASNNNMKQSTNDPIAAITASSATLIVARTSGQVLRFSLPHLVMENQYVVHCCAQQLAINCDNSRLSIIDINGTLTLLELVNRKNGSQAGTVLEFERKDAWDMIWSDDNFELFAVMERTKMYVFRGIYPEEPVQSSGYLCGFSDLELRAVKMDDIIADPEHPDRSSIVLFETKSLRDTRELLNTVPIDDAFAFIESNPHPRLWRLLAESALEQLNFTIADKAFVRCADYQGIQFVKSLKLLSDKYKQRAEVCVYFKKFDEAEQIYLDLGNRDLALELRIRVGDWFKVVALIEEAAREQTLSLGQEVGAGYDQMLTNAFDHIGEYYADRQKWQKAFKFFKKSNNFKQLAHCAYVLDNYSDLEWVLDQLSSGDKLAHYIGEKFASVGLCTEAVRAYLKAEDPRAAIDCCVLLNQWDQAVTLAERYSYGQIEVLLTKYASTLLQRNKLFPAIELYRKAKKHLEAAKLLIRIAKETPTAQNNPTVAKQLYLMAALEVDKHKAALVGSGEGTATLQNTMATLQTLLTLDSASGGGKDVDDAWRGTESLHFWLLAQRQLRNGQLNDALRTSLRLLDYDDLLPSKEIFSLIALVSFYCKHFGQCSRAFIKLETLQTLTKEERDHYRQLASNIFIRNSPIDPPPRLFNCPNSGKCDNMLPEWTSQCDGCGKRLHACVASGLPIFDSKDRDLYVCRTCKHRSYFRKLRAFSNCPLCHTPLSKN